MANLSDSYLAYHKIDNRLWLAQFVTVPTDVPSVRPQHSLQVKNFRSKTNLEDLDLQRLLCRIDRGRWPRTPQQWHTDDKHGHSIKDSADWLQYSWEHIAEAQPSRYIHQNQTAHYVIFHGGNARRLCSRLMSVGVHRLARKWNIAQSEIDKYC